MTTDSQRLTRLEELLSHLQHHVAEQDKVILGLDDQVTKLRKELAQLRERQTSGPSALDRIDEKPPHY